MKTINNSSAHALTLQELIFLNKNKEYGAFVLRKNYRRNLITALVIAIILLSGSVYSMFLSTKNVEKKTITQREKVIVIDDIRIDPDKPINIEKPKVIPKIGTVKFMTPKVVENTEEEFFPSIEELKDVNPGTMTMEGSEDGIDITLIDAVEPAPKDAEAPVKEPVFTFAEEMPQYPGGDAALIAFIASQIKYPELARKAGVEGKVIVTYIVDRNGSISNIEIVKGIGAGCDEEAVRVIRLLEKFSPGRQNGNAVKIKMALPIKFKLSNS